MSLIDGLVIFNTVATSLLLISKWRERGERNARNDQTLISLADKAPWSLTKLSERMGWTAEEEAQQVAEARERLKKE